MELRNQIWPDAFLKWTTVFVLLLFSQGMCKAQDCENLIDMAQRLYEKGQLEEAILSVEACKLSEDPSIKLAAYKIIALSYIGLNNEDLARASAVEIIKIDPDYSPGVLDNYSQFNRLLKSVKVIPKFSIGMALAFGTSINIPEVIEVHNSVEYASLTYESMPGYVISSLARYQVNEKLALSLSGMFTVMNYGSKYPTVNLDLSQTERLTYFTLPVSVEYLFNIQSNFIPFVGVGGYGSALMKSNANYYYNKPSTNEHYALEKVNTAENRKNWQFGACLNTGTHYKLNKDLLSLQLFYRHSFSALSTETPSFENNQISNQYLYMDDKVKLHSLTLMLGFSKILNYKILN